MSLRDAVRSVSSTVVALLVGPLALGAPAGAQEPPDDEARVLAVAESALEAITEEDLVAFTDLMVDEAVTFSAPGRDGEADYAVRTRDEWRARSIEGDVVERGFDPVVHVSGPVAVVWLPYDLYLDGAWSHCGVDIFSLVRTGEGWRIASLAWSYEQPPACRRHPEGPPGG